VLLSIADQTVIPRFSMVWDNTQKLVQTRNFSRASGNKMLLWANAYAVRNRIEVTEVTSRATLKAIDIPVTAFLPSTDDYKCLKQRMLTIVTRILAHHLPFFCKHSVVTHHIPHQYSAESAVKSEVVGIP